MDIRLLSTPDELETLLALARQLADTMKAIAPSALKAAFEDARLEAGAPFWQDMLAGKNGFALLAYEGGKAVGMAVVVLGRFTHLESLFVDESARGRGTGRALIARAQSEAVKRGREAMTLYVLRDNRRARALYQQCGFEDFRTMMYIKL